MKEKQKVAVVSGGTKGLGKAITDTLVERGWFVYTIGRTHDATSSASNRQKHILLDFSTEQPMSSIRNAISHSKIDLLVNNAGIAYNEDPKEISIGADFQKIFQINFLSPAKLTLNLEDKLHGSTVITLSSDLSYLPVANLGLYAASKSALNAWFRSYAQTRTETRFVIVAPSMIDTPMLKELLGERYTQFKDKMMRPNVLAKKFLEIESNQHIESGTEILIAHPNMAHSSEELVANKLFWEVEDK